MLGCGLNLFIAWTSRSLYACSRLDEGDTWNKQVITKTEKEHFFHFNKIELHRIPPDCFL